MSSSTTYLFIVAMALCGCSSPEENNHNQHDHDHDHGLVSNEHDAGSDAGHDEVDLAGVDFGDEITITPAARAYCECMLITCHDPFHETYGADDADAIAACQRAASSWPVAGSEQQSGDSIECRQYHCDNATTSSSCDNALGAACM